MSIFTKDCPVCAASHAVHVVRCGCGYCFDPNKLDGITQELEVISQEEQLYRDYLAARATQADDAVHAAKVAAARDRDNTVKAAEALLAEQTAMSARAELEAQDQRARAVKNRIKVVRSNRRERKLKASSNAATHSKPVSVREALAPKPTLAAPPPIPTYTVPPKPVVAIETKPAVRIEPPKPAIAAQPKAAPAPAPKTTNAVATHPRPATAARSAVPTKPMPRPAATPPSAPQRLNQTVAPTAAKAPVVADKPTPSFRASQAGKAALLSAAAPAPTSQDCPNCSAKVPLKAARCRCGFEMPSSASEIPSLALSPEERAAFMAALSPRERNPNR